MSTDLMLIPEKINPLVIFTPRGSQDILDAIRHKARSTPRDMSTKEGRAAIASLARTIASSKVFLDDSGKTLTEEWTQKTKSVNIERKRIREGLDDLRDEVRKPLTDWEDKEKNRIAVHETLLANLYRNSEFDCANPSIELIQSRQMIVGSVYASHQWEEFSERASQALDIVREKLQNALELAEKQEKERVELERLRHEESARLQQENERKQRERDERLQSEAADRARLAAELEAQRKADIASHERWREQERLQRERDEQEQRAKKAENDKKQSELRAKAAADKAKCDQEEAVRKERERITAERRKEEEATQKREMDKKHRAKIIGEIAAALILHGVNGSKLAYEIGNLIADGKIPHVKITY